jgi:hypothetical protein
MPGEIDDQINEIIGTERPPQPTIFHYIVWVAFGLMGVVFVILLAIVLFIGLRTALLYGFASLTGGI